MRRKPSRRTSPRDGRLDWLQIRCPLDNSSKSGNLLHVSAQVRDATRSRPVLLISKQGVFGAALHDRDLWRPAPAGRAVRPLSDPRGHPPVLVPPGQGVRQLRDPRTGRVAGPAQVGSAVVRPDSPEFSERALHPGPDSDPRLAGRCAAALGGTDEDRLSRLLDDLTRSVAGAGLAPVPAGRHRRGPRVQEPEGAGPPELRGVRHRAGVPPAGPLGDPVPVTPRRTPERTGAAGRPVPARRTAVRRSIRRSPPSKRA